MSQLGTGVPGDILSPMGTDLPGFHLSAAVVCASGQSAFVVSAFGQRYTAFRVESLAKSAQNVARLAKSVHNRSKASGMEQPAFGTERTWRRTPNLSPQTPKWRVAPPSPERPRRVGVVAMRFRAPRGWGRTPDAARTPCRRATPWLPPFRSPCARPSCPCRAPAPPWRSSWSRACCRWRAR